MSIEVRNLTKIYGTQRAVDDLTFTAERGKITGFLGPNGAGKSTTMKIAMGYLRPSSGDVAIDGVSVIENPLEVKMNTGYLPENNPLYLEMYVQEFLEFVARGTRIEKGKRKAQISDIIERCGLGAESRKKIHMLSKGYRQRVGLAKALLPDPNVLILDEPTTGLDPNQIIEIRGLIKDIASEKSVVLSTHILPEVEAICDKVVIINKGQLMLESEVKDLRKGKKQDITYEVTFESKVDESLFKGASGITSIKSSDQKSLLITGQSESVRKEILALIAENDLPMISIQQTGDSLENIFKELTKEAGEVAK